MRAVLQCEIKANDGSAWDTANLEATVAGLPLLTRHLLAFRLAGITEVEVVTSDAPRVAPVFARRTPRGLSIVFQHPDNATPATASDDPVLEQRADTLVDPRLISQLVRDYSDGSRCIISLDGWESNYPAIAKSPYRVGAPGPGEAEPCAAGETLHAIGADVQVNHNAPCEGLRVGRYYWHRVSSPEDRTEASRKVFLATMKPTDGFYARTNRRVSVPISKLLVRTPITPNAVTLIGLLCSVGGAVLYSGGTYWQMLAGSLVSWFASMLDGCDGEVARVKFRASEFGAWFEMVCDYLYYVFTFLGMGIGVARYTGNPFWYWAGVGSVFGTLVSFFVIARLKRRYARQATASDFGRAFQKKVGENTHKPLHALSRHLGFLITRAAMPYFIVLFTVLGIAPWILGMILVGTNMAWPLTLAAYPLFRNRAEQKNPE